MGVVVSFFSACIHITVTTVIESIVTRHDEPARVLRPAHFMHTVYGTRYGSGSRRPSNSPPWTSLDLNFFKKIKVIDF